jgi:hypothetical protein
MEKICRKCVESKPLVCFSRDASEDDCLSRVCRACAKAYRLHRNGPKPANWKKKTVDMAAYRKAWNEAHPGYHAAMKAAWYAKNPQRRRVRDAVKYALRKGKLDRWPCELCGDPKSHAHHPDYAAPLAVAWLCRAHHDELHAEFEKRCD